MVLLIQMNKVYIYNFLFQYFSLQTEIQDKKLRLLNHSLSTIAFIFTFYYT